MDYYLLVINFFNKTIFIKFYILVFIFFGLNYSLVISIQFFLDLIIVFNLNYSQIQRINLSISKSNNFNIEFFNISVFIINSLFIFK